MRVAPHSTSLAGGLLRPTFFRSPHSCTEHDFGAIQGKDWRRNGMYWRLFLDYTVNEISGPIDSDTVWPWHCPYEYPQPKSSPSIEFWGFGRNLALSIGSLVRIDEPVWLRLSPAVFLSICTTATSMEPTTRITWRGIHLQRQFDSRSISFVVITVTNQQCLKMEFWSCNRATICGLCGVHSM